jgi:hypothetical protein
MANLEVAVGLVDHKGIPDVTYDSEFSQLCYSGAQKEAIALRVKIHT